MSTKKPDITQIGRYLKEELDARAMHQLEREAQDDPFFTEAMEGFENSPSDQQANYADLQGRLAQRIAPAKERNIWLWRVLPVAACLLIALLIGYQYLSPRKTKQQYANIIKPQRVVPKADSIKPAEEQIVAATQEKLLARQAFKEPVKEAKAGNGIAESPIVPLPGVTFKPDTIEYKASAYTVRPNSNVNELLKKMEGFDVDSSGKITYGGQLVTKARLNGRDYAGGNVQQAVKSLPADVLEKIQVIDDYGDQAAKTGIKDGDPAKVLNFTIAGDSAKKKQLAANLAAKKAENGISMRVATRVITGHVSDYKGDTLIGASIQWKDNPRINTSTNLQGNFKITVPDANGTLVVNYVGFQSREVTVDRLDTLKIRLEAIPNALSEVVVQSYATKKRSVVTGSAPDNKANTVVYQAAQPINGWDAYNKYLNVNAIASKGETGAVETGFIIGDNGRPQNIHIINTDNKALNEKAMDLISKGSKWTRGSDNKEIRLKIKFHH